MSRARSVLLAAALCVTGTIATAPAAQAETTDLTVATFNASLNRDTEGQLLADLATSDNQQARNAAETIQRAEADIVLVNEFDHDADGEAARLFSDNYLRVSQNGAPAVDYPYSWSGPVNTGVPSGHDLNNDGTVGGPDDAFGFGMFPGQYGMVVYSKYPILASEIRTFQNFLWADMPGALLPDDPATDAPADWFSAEELEVVRLSSKTHADIPVDVNGEVVHVLAAHPTPPSFDGPERRNKLRNHDEIRMWADYVSDTADYLYDDAGTTGGLAAGTSFVILGDYNSDPNDGDSEPGAIQQLLEAPLVLDPLPTSEGAVEAAAQGGANADHLSDPSLDTADFADDPAPGNLRVDYVLLSAPTMTVRDAGVFWPTSDDPHARLTGTYPFPTSDHRLVWVHATVTGDDPEPTPTPTPSPDPTPSPSPTASQRPSGPGLPSTGV
ncbi:endonuclease/exonuclease/phosphatase family protein [Tessaracoccus terricola]